MENQRSYEQLIINGIRGLPQEVLAEIAHFVYFIRRRVTQPQDFEADLYTTLLEHDLDQLRQAELNHLEQEFANYEHQYPRE